MANFTSWSVGFTKSDPDGFQLNQDENNNGDSPSVSLGPNKTTTAGAERIVLNASASGFGGEKLNFSWSFVRGGYQLTPLEDTYHNPIPPNASEALYYPSNPDETVTEVVRVTATDGNTTVNDTIGITVTANEPPDAGFISTNYEALESGETTRLYDRSSDQNQDDLSRSWSIESGPGSLTNESPRYIRQPSVTYTAPSAVNGTVAVNISLTVSDGEYNDTSYNTINVTIREETKIDIYPYADATDYDTFSTLMSQAQEMTIDKPNLNYTSRDIEWTTSGVATAQNGATGPNATIDFTDEGQATVSVTATYTMPSGKVLQRTSAISGEVYELDPENHEHVDLTYAGDESATDNKYSAAIRLHESEVAYERLQQRLFGLPGTIPVEVVRPSLKDGCLICAYDDDKVYIRHNMSRIGYTMLHEFTHIAQAHNDMAYSGDYWRTLVEGHAEVEAYRGSMASTYTREPKPTKSDLKTLNYQNENDEYTEGQLLVEAMMVKYGRQAVLDILVDSEGVLFTNRFQTVTGDSFDSFYEGWHPEDPNQGYSDIAVENFPRFIYSQEKLVAISQAGNCRVADCDGISDYSPKWDIDADGEFEKSGTVVPWDGPEDGPTEVSLCYSKNGDSLTHTQVIGTGPDYGGFDRSDPTNPNNNAVDCGTSNGADDESNSGSNDPLPGFSNAPTDPDDDGVFEDINGDGRITTGDVQTMFANLDYVRESPNKYDYNGDGRVNTGDVQTLFEAV